jgi:phosphoglycolate phosphatase
MRAFDLVVFDLDGTLVETAPEIADAVNDVLRHYGWPKADEEQVARWIGHGTAALLLQAVAKGSGVSPAQLKDSDQMREAAHLYDGFYDVRCGTRSRLYPGARMTLAAFRAGGISQAIVTNKEARYTERVLAIHALETAVDRTISGDSLGTKKPDPAGVLACLDEFSVPPERALFVGDSSIDAATARNAGITAWLLPHGYNMGEPVETAGADRVIPDFAELRARVLGRSGSTAGSERPKPVTNMGAG